MSHVLYCKIVSVVGCHFNPLKHQLQHGLLSQVSTDSMLVFEMQLQTSSDSIARNVMQGRIVCKQAGEIVDGSSYGM